MRTLLNLAACVAIVVCSTAQAAVTATKDSADFDWKYEMTVHPTGQDLDANSVDDWGWYDGGPGILGGGILAMEIPDLLRASDTGGIWKAQRTNYLANGWTAEINVHVTIAPRDLYGFGFIFENVGGSVVDNGKAILAINSSKTRWGAQANVLLDSNDNADGLHTFRIAQEPYRGSGDPKFSVWRDNVLIGSELTDPAEFSWGGVCYLGSMGRHWVFDADLDYVRFTEGAYAPVPLHIPDNRQIPDNRELGSILNNDINNILWALSGSSETTLAEYKKAVRHLLDTKPGVLAQNVGMPDPVIYRTKVATTWDKYYDEVMARGFPAQAKTNTEAAGMKALLAAGTDPLTLTIEACRQRGVLIVASYRMNAEDFYGEQLNTYDFGRQHKDLTIPGASCLDPAHPEVFKHRMDIFNEVANQYDIDGIEFDFRRWCHMISNPHENYPILTKMVRQTRKMLDEVAKKKGRKRLLLGVRVAPTVEGAPLSRVDMSCKDLGLDVKTWINEGLVDYVCPSFFWGSNPGCDPKTGEFVALAKDTKVGIYPTVFPKSNWQDLGPDAERIDLDEPDALRRFRNGIVKAALRCYAEGADGISTFNWVPHHQPGMTKRNVRESWGLGAAKVQMHVHPMLRDRAALEAYLKSDQVLPPTDGAVTK